MSCNNEPSLSAQDVLDPKPLTLVLGSAKRLSINVFQRDENAAAFATGDCGCGDGDLVLPPTVTIVSSNIDIYLYPDTETPVLSAEPSETDITDADAALVGYKLSYLVNTSTTPLNVVGRYVAVFQYELDTGEINVVPVYFNVVAAGFLSGC